MAFDGRLISNVGVLAAVAEAGSFARAADALGLSPSGVSRAVARLEARIGIRLLDRTTRSVALTDEGRRLYAEIAPLLGGIEDAVTLVSGSSGAVRGRLRVNVDAYFLRLVLAPHLGRFLDRHPDLTLDLVTSEEIGDLVAEGYDLAMRFGEPPVSSTVARKLLDTRVLTVAAPAYLKKHGTPASPSDMARHTCLHFRDPRTGRPFEWELQRGRKTVPLEATGRLYLADGGALLNACLAGAGIAQVMALGVQDLVDKGRLVDLFPDWPDETLPLYALYPSRHLPAAKVRAFIDFVASVIG
jgi:DNA-binding transcriptional LysR family regulator